MQKTYVSRSKAAKWLNVSRRSIDKVCLVNGIPKQQVPGHSRVSFRADLIIKLAIASGINLDGEL